MRKQQSTPEEQAGKQAGERSVCVCVCVCGGGGCGCDHVTACQCKGPRGLRCRHAVMRNCVAGVHSPGPCGPQPVTSQCWIRLQLHLINQHQLAARLHICQSSTAWTATVIFHHLSSSHSSLPDVCTPILLVPLLLSASAPSPRPPTLSASQAVRLSDFGTPGAALSGVHYLRNVADADSLLQGVAAAKAAGGQVRE